MNRLRTVWDNRHLFFRREFWRDLRWLWLDRVGVKGNRP